MNEDIKIYIDLIDESTIQGWFINVIEPESNKILLYLDGDYKAVTLANVERQDVAEAHGKLESGFCFDITKFPVFQKIEIRSDNKDLLLSLENIERENTQTDSRQFSGIVPIYSQERHRLLEKITIDLTRPINGDNWYDIEPTGRWSGPKLESTLNIPALSEGNYQLQLEIGAAFCDLAAMEVMFNNQPVRFLNTEYHLPVLLYAEVSVDKQYSFWHLSFKYPETHPPEGELGADQRKLGIFLKNVSLTKITSVN